MTIIIASFAVIFCWIWIELFISLSLTFSKENNSKLLTPKKFKWILRIIIFILFILIIVYMYFFENDELKKTISLCIGLIK